jgi:hypothetical protein
VNWESLWFNHAQRRMRQFVTTPFAILVVFAPVALLTSAISSLNQQFCAVRAAAAAAAGMYCNQAESKMIRIIFL